MQERDQRRLYAFLQKYKRHFSSNGGRECKSTALQNYVPREDLRQSHLSSSGKTFGNIVISIVGAGVLGLPYTFKTTGWLLSTMALSLVAALCYYCMMLLVWSRKRLEKVRGCYVESFSDLGFLLYGKWGRLAVDFMLVLSQGAFCIAYLVFIGENLASVFSSRGNAASLKPHADLVQDLSDRNASNSMHILKRLLVEVTRDDHTIAGLFSSKQDFVWISFPLEIMLASIYTLTKLAPFSIFADIVNFGSMALVMQQDVVTMISKGVCSVSVYNSLKTLPFAIGVAIYAYEGIALVIPLESSMLEREKFGKVLGLAMVSITALYITFGLFGYLAFGEETLDIVTMNLEPGLKTTLVKLGLCVGLLFTFAVMMFPVHQVMEQRLVRGKPNTLLRIVVVLMATLCATAVPRFGDFLSLVGNSVCCALAFVVPSCFHMKAHRDDISKSMLCIDYIIMIFGTAYGVWGTILAWSNISPAN